jgi:hypothetical protein
MADALTAAREMIENRIQEIDKETARLRQALAELTGGGGGRGRRVRGSARKRSSGRRARKIAPRGQRREQLLAHLEKNPGARPAEIAKAMGTTPANVQNVLRKARQEKVVRRRRGGGYALAPPASATTPAAAEPPPGAGGGRRSLEAGLQRQPGTPSPGTASDRGSPSS